MQWTLISRTCCDLEALKTTQIELRGKKRLDKSNSCSKKLGGALNIEFRTSTALFLAKNATLIMYLKSYILTKKNGTLDLFLESNSLKFSS